MLNGVHLIGTVRDVETKTYPDGAVVTHFLVDYPRTTRIDSFSCRLIQRKGMGLSLAIIPKEGEVVAVAGKLTTAGADGRRTIIDVRSVSTAENWGA